MATDYRWYPEGDEGQAQFNENLATNLPLFKSKYSISQATLDRVAANAAWQRYWVDYRANFELESKQLTKYYNALAQGKDAGGAITAPIITQPVNPPAEIEPDIESFVKAVRREIRSKTNYSIADGELLGFEPPQPTHKPDDEITAEFKVRTLANFMLYIEFLKQGLDAIRLEVRHKGGDWKKLDTLTANGEVEVEPSTPGQAEQIELRAVMLRKNQPVGNYSEIQVALIAP